jgi:hypothetical protein
MATYDYIINPTTGKKVSLNTQLGLNILERYTNELEGGGLKEIKEWFIKKKKERTMTSTQKLMKRLDDDHEKTRIIKVLIKNIPREVLENNRSLVRKGRKDLIAFKYFNFTVGSTLEELRNIADKHDINLYAKKLSRSSKKDNGPTALKKHIKEMKDERNTTGFQRLIDNRTLAKIERIDRGPISGYNVRRAKTIMSKPLEDRGIWKGD